MFLGSLEFMNECSSIIIHYNIHLIVSAFFICYYFYFVLRYLIIEPNYSVISYFYNRFFVNYILVYVKIIKISIFREFISNTNSITLFFFIFFLFLASICGLTPCAAFMTMDLWLLLTFAWYWTCTVDIIILNIYNIASLTFFTVKSTNFFLAIILVITEIMSYLAKWISYFCRLLANIVAGHIMFDLIDTLSCKCFNYLVLPSAYMFFFYIMLFFETLVYSLQVYIFICLARTYFIGTFKIY